VREKQLLYLKDQDGKEHYYIFQDDEYEILRYKRYYDIIEEKNVIKKNEFFKGQLVLYLGQCADLKDKIYRSSYKTKSLVNLFNEYSSCIGGQPDYIKKNDKISLVPGVIAGGTLSTLKFTGESAYYHYLVMTDFSSSVNVSLGGSLDLILPRNQGKWSIYNDLLYTNYTVDGNYSYTDYSGLKQYNVYSSIGMGYLKWTFMGRFRFQAGKTMIFMNGGFTLARAITERNYRKAESWWYDEYNVKEDIALAYPRYFEQGLAGGLGVQYKNFCLEFRYERTNGISDYQSLKSRISKYYALLSYRFEKK